MSESIYVWVYFRVKTEWQDCRGQKILGLVRVRFRVRVRLIRVASICLSVYLCLYLCLCSLCLCPYPLTLKPQPSTLNPQPSTLNPQPSTLTLTLSLTLTLTLIPSLSPSFCICLYVLALYLSPPPHLCRCLYLLSLSFTNFVLSYARSCLDPNGCNLRERLARTVQVLPFALSCLVLSDHVLPCPVLLCPVLPCLVCLVLSSLARLLCVVDSFLCWTDFCQDSEVNMTTKVAAVAAVEATVVEPFSDDDSEASDMAVVTLTLTSALSLTLTQPHLIYKPYPNIRSWTQTWWNKIWRTKTNTRWHCLRYGFSTSLGTWILVSFGDWSWSLVLGLGIWSWCLVLVFGLVVKGLSLPNILA